jgi:hypothetical protein
MYRLLRGAAVLAVVLWTAEPALAQVKPIFRAQTGNYQVLRPLQPKIKPPLPLLAKIKPSQAAAIAQRAMPDAKVIGVKLLPSGNYAVTLRTASAVARVTVSGNDGSIL